MATGPACDPLAIPFAPEAAARKQAACRCVTSGRSLTEKRQFSQVAKERRADSSDYRPAGILVDEFAADIAYYLDIAVFTLYIQTTIYI